MKIYHKIIRTIISKLESLLPDTSVAVDSKIETTDWKRPDVLSGDTREVLSPCGSVFITISEHPQKKNPIEILVRGAKNGTCTNCFHDTLSRLLSLCLRKGVKPEKLIKYMKGSPCAGSNDFMFSCPHAVAIALEKRVSNK